MVRHADAETREEIDEALTPDEAVIIDDPLLPESLQGVRPPSWWAKGRPSPTARAMRKAKGGGARNADGKQTLTFAD